MEEGLIKLMSLLIRLSFYKLTRMKGMREVLAAVDGIGLRLGEAPITIYGGLGGDVSTYC